MPLVSIVTATYRPSITFLLQAWESICKSAPANWDFEWCLQEDGSKPLLLDHLPDDFRIRYAQNTLRAGAAATRNAAIARANGEWIFNLDSDDYYTDQGLATLLALIDDYPSSIWVAGRAHDIYENENRLVSFPNYLPSGRVDSETFLDSWKTSELVFPIHPAGAGLRSDVMRMLGGYPALPVGEDVSLFAAATQLGPGAYSSSPVFVYRRWDGQTTKQLLSANWQRTNIEYQRIAAMKQLDLRMTLPS